MKIDVICSNKNFHSSQLKILLIYFVVPDRLEVKTKYIFFFQLLRYFLSTK